MFVLAWVFLGGYPDLRNGIILIGIARCIAMVIVWNNLAEGDNEWTAILVAINSVFQIVMYSVLAYFYITIGSRLDFRLRTNRKHFPNTSRTISGNLLRHTLLAGILTRYYFLKTKGKEWYEHKLMHNLSHISLIALLFTIVVMFSLKGQYIVSLPLDVVRVAIPLLVYFLIMFSVAFAIGYYSKLGYKRTTSLSFTAASNNFELA